MRHKESDLAAEVVAAIAALWEEGCPVASDPAETAPIAIRRWNSSARRGVKAGDFRARTHDLAKGLVYHFERDPKLVGPLWRDYEYLADRIASVFQSRPQNPGS